MKLKYKFFAVSVIFLGLALFVLSNANAQEGASLDSETASSEAEEALEESNGLDDELEPLEGLEISEPKSMPSAFGFWWRNIREWTSLALTADPVKKAEKHLKFAEERARLANYIIQNSADPKVQDKARQMLDKANQYMQNIEDKKDDLVSKADEKSQKLLRNLAKHHLNKERILEKIEDKLPPEKIEEFQQLRKTFGEKGQNLLDNLQNNPNVSQEVKDRIKDVSLRVENMQKMREEFRGQQKEILKEIKAGSQEAKEKFEELRKSKKENLEQLKEQFKEQKDEIIDKIQEGDKNAVEKLKELNKKRQMEAAKIREEMKNKSEEAKDEIKKKRQELLQKMQIKNDSSTGN